MSNPAQPGARRSPQPWPVAVMRNRFTAGDLTTVARIDQIVGQTLS